MRNSLALCMATEGLACISRQGEVELRREVPRKEVTAALVELAFLETCLSLCRNHEVVIAKLQTPFVKVSPEGGNRLLLHCRWCGEDGGGVMPGVPRFMAGNHDPLSREITVRYCWSEQDGKNSVAVLEMSEASGMRRLTKNELDPLRLPAFDIRGGSLYDALSGVTGRRRRKAS